MLEKCIEGSPPPTQTLVHRASKQPGLPTIYSRPGSPHTPTHDIRRVKERRARAKSIDSALFSDSDSEGSVPGRHCRGCGRKKSSSPWLRLVPCQARSTSLAAESRLTHSTSSALSASPPQSLAFRYPDLILSVRGASSRSPRSRRWAMSAR
jgi:hypothetical protein